MDALLSHLNASYYFMGTLRDITDIQQIVVRFYFFVKGTIKLSKS